MTDELCATARAGHEFAASVRALATGLSASTADTAVAIVDRATARSLRSFLVAAGYAP